MLRIQNLQLDSAYAAAPGITRPARLNTMRVRCRAGRLAGRCGVLGLVGSILIEFRHCGPRLPSEYATPPPPRR